MSSTLCRVQISRTQGPVVVRAGRRLRRLPESALRRRPRQYRRLRQGWPPRFLVPQPVQRFHLGVRLESGRHADTARGRTPGREARRRSSSSRPCPCAHRLQREAVIGLGPRNHMHLVRLAGCLPVEARGLECGLVASVLPRHEEHGVEPVGGQTHQPLGESDGRYRASSGCNWKELRRAFAHLRGGGVCQFLAPVAKVEVPEAGEAVDELAAVDVLGGGPAPARPDDGVGVIARMLKRMNEVRVVESDKTLVGLRTDPLLVFITLLRRARR